MTGFGDRVMVTRHVLRVMATPRERMERDPTKASGSHFHPTRGTGEYDLHFKVLVGWGNGKLDAPFLQPRRHWPGDHVPFDQLPHSRYMPNPKPGEVIQPPLRREQTWTNFPVIRCRRVPITEHDVLHKGIVVAGKPTWRAEGIRYSGSGWDDPGWLYEDRRVGLLWEVAIHTESSRSRLVLVWQGDLLPYG